MTHTINVNDTYKLCFAYDCDEDYMFYDIYDNNEKWLGEIPMKEVMDNCIDEETEEFDEDGLEILIEDIINE